MRVHRLTLRGVKGVVERTIALPDRGVVVLEGPNEVGKTTTLHALDALLSYRSSSRAAAVRALQPVGSDVGPFVEAELTIGGVRLRYAKCWLRQPATTLHLLGDRPEQLTGDAAQQRVDDLLRRHLDRTLYDALRLTQAGEATLAPLSSSTVLTEALDRAAGAEQHVEGADILLDRVEAEYRHYFTATGRPTGDYRAAITRCAQAQQDVAEAHRRREEGQTLLDRQQTAREAGVAAERALAEAERALAEAEATQARAAAAAALLDAARERRRHVAEQLDVARRALDQRRQLVEEHEHLQVRLAERQARRQEAWVSLTDAREGSADRRRRAEEASARVEVASETFDAARAAAEAEAARRALADAEAQLARAQVLADRVRSAQRALPAVEVSRATVRQVRALQDRLDAMVLAHDAASPVLEVRSLGAPVGISVADGESARSVAPGGTDRVTLAHETTIDVPGQVELRLTLHQEAQGRLGEIRRLREERDAALAQVGARDLDELEVAADVTEAARAALHEAQRELEALVRPLGAAAAAEAAAGQVPGALLERVERARAAVLALGEWSQPELDVEQAAQLVRQAREGEREARQRAAEAEARAASLAASLGRLEGQLDADAARVDSLEVHLFRARAEQPEAALQARLDACQAELAEAEGAVTCAESAAREADPAGVAAALEHALQRHRAAVQRRESALAELHSLRGQVEMAASEGRQELYEQAVAALDDADRELRALDRRARAARHLRTALLEHRDEAHRSYVRPYTEALEELGRRVYGDGFAVTVEDDLTISARTLGGVTVPHDDLSGGAKEQLGILARLAVARLVDPEHGVPVVIDDALGYTDPHRLRRMGEVLGAGAAGQDLQVILLTCTPDRYAAIPAVHTIRLSA